MYICKHDCHVNTRHFGSSIGLAGDQFLPCDGHPFSLAYFCSTTPHLNQGGLAHGQTFILVVFNDISAVLFLI